MTILILIAFILVVLLVEYVSYRNRPLEQRERAAPIRDFVPTAAPAVVEGFRFDENLTYHQGHTWALGEGPRNVRVGIDDLAGRVVGSIDSVSTPVAGKWVRQGQPAISLMREGKVARLVSPIEGIVTEINPDLAADPDLARRDPYGKGWVMVVEAPEPETSFRNLLSGSTARAWMKDAAQRLRWMLQEPASSLAQDGGELVDDLMPYLSIDWDDAVRELFLTE